jgi:hypothetical protein
MPFSIWDLGGCNCPAPPPTTCDCPPVPLPQENLTGTVNGSAFPLTYGFDGPCTWSSGCRTGGGSTGNNALLEITSCSGGCFSIRYIEGEPGNPAAICQPESVNIGFVTPGGGCAGIDTGLEITSFTASPLNIVLSDGTNTIVITL